jgi:hypothetical protein
VNHPTSSYKRFGRTPPPGGRKKEWLRQDRLEHDTTQFSCGRRVLRSGGPNHVNHRVHRVHLELTTKRLKTFPTKEPQRAVAVAAPVEVSQNHFDSCVGKVYWGMQVTLYCFSICLNLPRCNGRTLGFLRIRMQVSC